MSLKEQVYSVLIVSAAERFNDALSLLLPPSRYQPVCKVSDISTAKRALAERTFDFVIINSPLPDDPGIRFAIDTSADQESWCCLWFTLTCTKKYMIRRRNTECLHFQNPLQRQ